MISQQRLRAITLEEMQAELARAEDEFKEDHKDRPRSEIRRFTQKLVSYDRHGWNTQIWVLL